MATEGKRTQLRIIDCRPVYHGKNAKGDEYTIHEIRASRPDGTLVNEKLRSFTALPVGQTIEVTVTPYVSEQYGKSFTLYPVNKGTGTTAQQNEIQGQLTQQAENLALLARRVAELETQVAVLQRNATAPAVATPQSDALDAAFGADPPFA